jgi:hypothetical protein
MVDPISLIAAVAGVISAVRDGQELFSRWRRKRRQKREAAAGLDTALVGCPSCSMYTPVSNFHLFFEFAF